MLLLDNRYNNPASPRPNLRAALTNKNKRLVDYKLKLVEEELHAACKENRKLKKLRIFMMSILFPIDFCLDIVSLSENVRAALINKNKEDS